MRFLRVAVKIKRRQAATTANTKISNVAAVAARFSEAAVVANRMVAGRTVRPPADEATEKQPNLAR
jgi:hypothetical protein